MKCFTVAYCCRHQLSLSLRFRCVWKSLFLLLGSDAFVLYVTWVGLLHLFAYYHFAIATINYGSWWGKNLYLVQKRKIFRQIKSENQFNCSANSIRCTQHGIALLIKINDWHTTGSPKEIYIMLCWQTREKNEKENPAMDRRSVKENECAQLKIGTFAVSIAHHALGTILYHFERKKMVWRPADILHR